MKANVPDQPLAAMGMDALAMESTRLMELLKIEAVGVISETLEAMRLLALAYWGQVDRRVELKAENMRLQAELEAAQARIVELLQRVGEAEKANPYRNEED